METITIQITTRATFGKSNAAATRRSGKLPGILYGPKRAATPVLMDAKDFERRVASLEGAHLIRMESTVPDIGGRLALVKELQRDPLTREVLHTDLYEVDLERKLRLRVTLHFIGKAAGVERGGILQPIQREVAVLCLPTDIPNYIEVDVSGLDIHDAIHVSAVKPPPGVELAYETDEPVVTVLPPTVEEVKVAAEVVEGAPVEGAPVAEGEAAAAGKGAPVAAGKGLPAKAAPAKGAPAKGEGAKGGV